MIATSLVQFTQISYLKHGTKTDNFDTILLTSDFKDYNCKQLQDFIKAHIIIDQLFTWIEPFFKLSREPTLEIELFQD
jgi:hypothetical protein